MAILTLSISLGCTYHMCHLFKIAYMCYSSLNTLAAGGGDGESCDIKDVVGKYFKL